MNSTRAEARTYLPILLVGIALVLAAEVLGLFTGMDNHSYDLFFRLRGPREPDNRILIAAVDEHTLESLGRWPLRRSHYARLLERLGKASLVGLDILLVEPTDDDAVLAEAVGIHGRVVVPAYIVKPLQVADALSSLPARRVGHVHLEQEIDGVVRKVYHTLYAGGKKLPSLASAMYETLTGNLVVRKDPAGSGRDRTTQARIIQMDARRINYYGPPGSFPRISVVDIINDRYPADFFKERIVLVGVTAAGLEAGVLTPFTQHRDQMNGVEAHAHILGNLIDRNSIVDVPDAVRWIFSVCFAFLGLFLFLRAEGKRAVLLWVLGVAAASVATLAVFVLFHLWFSPVLPCILLSFMSILAYVFRLDHAVRKLGEAKEEWEESFNTINDAIVLMDCQGLVLRTNVAAKTLLGPHLLEVLARKCSPMQGEGHRAPGPGEAQDGSAASGDEPGVEEIFDPGTDRHLEIKSLPRVDPLDRVIGFVHIARDITARKKAEEEKERFQFQLIQSQKMQTVGRLAGGVAHDFNNILTVILGYSEMALAKIPGHDRLRDYIQIIHDSGLKASALTRQLLAFSRKQVTELQVVNLKDIVESMAKILGRIIGEDVTLKLRLETPLRNILADPVQLEQVLMNLAVNARDAMPRGGVMTIETADVELDEAYAASHEGVVPGSYAMLAVTDTGGGMSPAVQARIFEPFFTTKKVGEGTGLGLATVQGIIKQMSGHIYVYSEEGRGSVFKVYLPVCREDAAEKVSAAPPAMPRGTETVLIAEDDPAIRKLIADILEPLGYRVIVARSGAEAMRLAETSRTKVDLLLTDVVMPEMGGKELAQMFQSIYPHIKVLFMSGYTEEIVIRHGVAQDGVAFIQKPLIPNKLVLKLREVLDGK